MTLSTRNLQKQQQQEQKNKSVSKSPRKYQKQTNETNSTASEFSDNNSNSNSSPARSFVSESNTNNLSIGSSSQAEVFQMLLLHKKVALEANLRMEVEGFPDITLLSKEICAEKIGYKEKKIPFRMRGELSPSVHKDVSMRSCISRDAGSARSMYSCLPLEGEKSLRVLPREMSRRARMEERRNISKRSNRSMNGDKSPCNLKLEDDNYIELKFDNSEIIVNSESNEALLDNSGNTVGIQVTRRATVVDIPPFSEIENHTKTSQNRGRSTGRRGGENTRDRSVSQFSSRKERAAFFINLKNEKSEQRSVSPFGHYDTLNYTSPEPTSSRSVRSTSSKKSSYSHFGQGGGDKLTFGMSAGKSDQDFFAARMGEGVVKKDEVKSSKPVKSSESSSSSKSPQSRDVSIESKTEQKMTRRNSIESIKEQKQILKEIIENKKKQSKTVFSKSDTQMSILGEAEPFQRGFAGQKTMKSSENRSQSRGRSLSLSLERQVTADGQTMATIVDFSKVDTKRFSREPSLEPIFMAKSNSLLRSGSVEPLRNTIQNSNMGFKATPFAGSSSVRGTSLPPKPGLNFKGTLIDISLVNAKLESMAIGDEVNKGVKGEFLSTTPNFPRSRSRSQSPEPDARSCQLLAAGPTGGIGFRRSRSPVAVRQ